MQAEIRESTAGDRLTRGVWAIAAAEVALLLATSGRYGYHRDELYFIVAGGHPAFGYPDQPALVPLLCAAMNAIAHGSLLMLRLPAALAAGATVVISGLVARDLRGGRAAQVIAAACTASGAITLASGHLVTPTTFDVLATTTVGWLLIRAVLLERPRCLLWAGIVVGIGFEAKPQIAFVGTLAVAILGLVGPRWPFRSWWLVVGIVVALALASPYVVWQATHGWPQLTVAGSIAGSAEGGRVGFVPFQLALVSPVLVPVWVAGLVSPWRRAGPTLLRFVPLTYLALALAYLAGNGKAYYLASLYPVLLGLGALPVAGWLATRRRRQILLVAAVAVSFVINAVIALPVLPERKLQGSAVMALNPDQGETVGWPRFEDTVARSWDGLTPAQRREAVIFTSNYGEASAVDLLGRDAGLPSAYSGHNAYSEWGPPRGAHLAVLLGFTPATAADAFTDCRQLATIDDGVGLDNDEQGLPVLLCRPIASWSSLWPRLTHFN